MSFFYFYLFFFMYSASVFMLPTVFNELLMGINVRILNEILSLVEIKKKQFADGALFYIWGSLVVHSICGKQVFAARLQMLF